MAHVIAHVQSAPLVIPVKRIASGHLITQQISVRSAQFKLQQMLLFASYLCICRWHSFILEGLVRKRLNMQRS